MCKLETLLQSEVTVVTSSEAAAAMAGVGVGAALGDSAKTPPLLRRRKRNLSRRAGERDRDSAGGLAGGGGGVGLGGAGGGGGGVLLGDRSERGMLAEERRERREMGESHSGNNLETGRCQENWHTLTHTDMLLTDTLASICLLSPLSLSLSFSGLPPAFSLSHTSTGHPHYFHTLSSFPLFFSWAKYTAGCLVF